MLTIKIKDRRNSRVEHSVDFAFVNDYEDNKGNECREYIHLHKGSGQYSWADQSNPFHLDNKINWLKENKLWGEMKNVYIDKKNYNDDLNKKSRSLFAEAVNDTYHKYNE